MDRLPCDSCTATAAAEDGAANRYNPKAENQFEEVSPNRLTCKRVALVLAVFLWLVLIVGCALILWIKFPSFQNLKTTTTTTSAVKHKKTIHRQSSNVNNISDVLLNPLATHTDSLRIHWMSNNSFLFLDKADRFMKYTTTTLGNPSDLKTKLFAKRQDLNASDLMFSSDAKFVALLQHQTAFPFNRFLCSIVEITHGTLGKRHNIAIERAEDHGLDVFLWCPQFGSRDFVFVFKNDVYYQSVGAESIKITNSNSEFLFFGSGDWMSREEILDQSIWWSKSGRYIAFAAYDSTSVSKSTVTFRVDREQIDQRIPYAHPGDKNLPIVKIHVWDKVQKTSRVIFPFDLHTESSANFQYLMSAMWGSSSEQGEYLLTIWSNRIQNMISIVICFIDFTCFPFFKFEYAIKGRGFWAEPSTLSLKYATANGFFLILPRVNSDGNVYNNVAYIDISQLEPGNLHYNIRFHDGRFDVEEILGYDAERDELFLSGAGGIGEFHVFRITTASVANDLLPQCVSCSIKNCFHTKTSFSPSSQWLLIACQRPYYFPEVYLKSTSNILDSKLIQNHKHNYHKELSAQLPTLRFEVVPLTHGLDAHVQLILPPLFHPDRLYPVLLSVYGGPSSNAVQKKTPGYLDTLLCVGQGAVVVRIDARGSGQRGWNRRGAVYRQLGGPEVSDQLETIKNLLKRFSFMDKNRIATYGWSYGGFMALHMAQKDQGNMLKCAIAGGSVVDFTYYDSAYVERYMQMPQDNPLGYKATSILNTHTLEAFSKIRLLLVHGEADENVHYSNAAALIRQLQLEGRHFVQLTYPNERHSIIDTHSHLMLEINRFLTKECFSFQ